MASSNRRRFIKQAAGVGLLSPLHPLASFGGAAENFSPQQKLHIVCLGAHPDDPESGCGGTLLLYARAGHRVSVVYLTKGEAGIEGKGPAEAAAIRTKEVEAACRIIGAQPYFLGQVDGSTIFNRQAVDTAQQLLQQLQPDMVFTHWPVDTHPDHQVASLLAYQCWLRLKRAFPLYYFEVNSGSQTMQFHPTDYVDITPVAAAKKQVIYAHASQDPDDIYLNHHVIMQQFRGREIGVKEAEAFVRLDAVKQPIGQLK